MKPDLTLLYSQVGLKPGCTLAELQLAYRRRISELQPNPLSAGSESPDTSALLRNLIWLYTTASRFHRRYGRLPGAAPRHTALDEWRHQEIQRVPAAPLAHDHQAPRTQGTLGLSLLLVILLLGLLALGNVLTW